VEKYWLVSRPPPLINDDDKKAARSKAAKKSYRARLEREEREAAIRKRQYEEGKIPFSEYKFVLVGEKRRKAELEYRITQPLRFERQALHTIPIKERLWSSAARLGAKKASNHDETLTDNSIEENTEIVRIYSFL